MISIQTSDHRRLSDDGEGADGYAGSSAQCGARRARRRAGGPWGTVAEGFEPRGGAARASWLWVWASPCRGGERTSGIRRCRARWRAKSLEGRACTGRSSTQVVSPRVGARCVPGLRGTLPARARNVARWACACCRARPRAVLVHSARFWFRAARILGDQASCQWPWHPDAACAVQLCAKARCRPAGENPGCSKGSSARRASRRRPAGNITERSGARGEKVAYA